MISEHEMALRFKMLSEHLDERQRRLLAAAEAISCGRGGVMAASRATSMSKTTVSRGVRELLECCSARSRVDVSRLVSELEEDFDAAPSIQNDSDFSACCTSDNKDIANESGCDADTNLKRKPKMRVRRPGAGRRAAIVNQPGLIDALKRLVDPVTRGDPMSPLLWTTKSVRNLADELAKEGFKASRTLVAKLLADLGYSLQGLSKGKEGSSHPDRDAQFRYIAEEVQSRIDAGLPVISIDTKKKEIVGEFHNKGREWRPQGEPEKVSTHDFMDKELGKVIPYGVYDVGANQGWVSVGIDHDTSEFAAETIGHWWRQMGYPLYGDAGKLLVTADAGGSNGYRLRFWKLCLQRLADATNLEITVCHLPPGTSKWNKIEHRMFSQITANWRSRPLTSRETVVSLIASTTTRTGLKVDAALDESSYATGTKVNDETLASLNIRRHEFHGDWNYDVSPTASKKEVGGGGGQTDQVIS